MAQISEPCVVLDMSEAEYHSDPVVGGSLSSSGAKQILKSPAHYLHSLTHKWHKPEFDLGSAVHTQVLGTGWPVDVYDFDSWRTKAAQDKRDESHANDRIPVLAKDYEPVVAMASAVLLHPVAGRLFEGDGDAEVSAFATDTYTQCWLRARIDWLPVDGPLMDLKTARSAEPQAWARSAAEYGYDIQRAIYGSVHHAVTNEDRDFMFVVVESSPPHLVSVIELDDEFAAIGRQRMRAAIDLFAKCKANDDFTAGYDREDGEPHVVAAPSWLRYEEGF